MINIEGAYLTGYKAFSLCMNVPALSLAYISMFLNSATVKWPPEESGKTFCADVDNSFNQYFL